MSEENSKFKVSDKRRFNQEGEDQPEVKNKVEDSTTNIAGDNFIVKDSSEEEPTVNFASFVVSLATQALMQLGEMPPPEGMNIPVDRGIAKQHIDLLNMLKDKTKGNLDPQENHLLDEVLHTLRMAYVKNV